ncbi:MAG TPA: hypothetical protein VF047_09410 [Nitrososphaeraceae archaeon]
MSKHRAKAVTDTLSLSMATNHESKGFPGGTGSLIHLDDPLYVQYNYQILHLVFPQIMLYLQYRM